MSNPWHRVARASAVAVCVIASAIAMMQAAVIEKAPTFGGLFLDVPAPDQPVKVRSVVSRRRVVTVDLPALRARRAVGSTVHFNIFGDANFTGIIERVIVRSDDDFSLMGKLNGERTSTFALAVKDGIAVLNIRRANVLYQLRHLGNSFYDLRQIDAHSYPTCGTTERHAVSNAKADAAEEKTAKTDSGATIDLMVVYTPAALDAAGGTAAMQATIQLAVDESNAAYEQSQITPRLRLVHQQLVNYTESGTFETDLDRLTAGSDGQIDQIHSLRNTYGADVVSMFIEDDDYCGLAWLMTSVSAGFASSAFSVVWWECATGLYTLAHELGHNMGCAHDRQNAAGAGAYNYSYGWRFTTAGNVTNRTIMAYAPGERIQHFSNPNVLYNGVATGVPAGQPNAANNALTINNTATVVANWRQQVVTCIYDIRPAITNVPRSALTGTLSVIASSNDCAWTAISDSPFITLVGPTNGTGSGAIAYSILTNTSVNSRTGIVTVAGREFAVVQAGNVPVIPVSEAVDLNNHFWTTGGHAEWAGQTAVTKDSVDAAQSGAMGNSQQSYVQAMFYGPGTLGFWWKVSSETNYDYFHVVVNGRTNHSVSGVVDWQFHTLSLTNGAHLVRWIYSKDSSISDHADAAWLDLVQPTGDPYFARSLTQPGATGFRLEVNGPTLAPMVMEASTNLSAWSPIATSAFNTSGIWIYTNSNAATPRRFYRVFLP